MRILLLSLVFSPDSVSTSVLMTELVLELKKMGHELTVLTTTPHYNVEPEARQRQPLKPRWGRWLYESNCDEIPVYHATIPVKGSRVGARMLDYLRFHAISTLAGLTFVKNYDLILAPSPPLTIGLSAWIIARFRHIPFIYNVQEIYPDVAVSLGMIQNKKLIRLLSWLEKFVYGRADHISVISPWFKHRLQAKGVPEQKLTVIPNFVDTDFMQPGPKANDFAQEHQLAHRFTVLYAGNIGLTQGFETIFETAQSLVDQPDIHFLIVGDGTRRQWLEEQIAQHALPNITLLPYQPRSKVPQIYASSDLCLVPLKRGTAQETFPSKIYTIMAAGRPVIASADADSELAWVVGAAGCGWAVPPDDASALARAIHQAYQERAALATKGKAGRAFVVANHSRQAVAAQYSALFQHLTGDKVCPETADHSLPV